MVVVNGCSWAHFTVLAPLRPALPGLPTASHATELISADVCTSVDVERAGSSVPFCRCRLSAVCCERSEYKIAVA